MSKSPKPVKTEGVPSMMLIPEAIAKQPRMVLRLPKGLLVVRMTSDIPLKDDHGLQTSEYTIYVNAQTYRKITAIAQTNDVKELDRYLMKDLVGVVLTLPCYDVEKAEAMVKEAINEQAERRLTNEDMQDVFRWDIQSRNGTVVELQSTDKLYHAKLDFQNRHIGLIQYAEPYSALKPTNHIHNKVLVQGPEPEEFVTILLEVLQILSVGYDFLIEMHDNKKETL